MSLSHARSFIIRSAIEVGRVFSLVAIFLAIIATLMAAASALGWLISEALALCGIIFPWRACAFLLGPFAPIPCILAAQLYKFVVALIREWRKAEDDA